MLISSKTQYPIISATSFVRGFSSVFDFILPILSSRRIKIEFVASPLKKTLFGFRAEDCPIYVRNSHSDSQNIIGEI